ncbi:MAG TPA: ABC transporter permease [Bellilinea sp.]|nr:ABC transporter permease [Bellilinea sp.]
MKRKVLVNLVGVLLALLLGSLVMLLQGYNPIDTYYNLFAYSLAPSKIPYTLSKSVPLVLTGLSASVSFASGPINLGQPGQLLMGALFATVGGLYVDLPPVLMIPFLLILAMLGGMIWSGLAGLAKHFFNMNEFITTLMLNMIADFFTAWAISYPFFEKNANHPQTPPIARSGWLPEIGNLNISVLIMLLAFIAVWFIFNRTKQGYEWRISGQNSLFSRLGGVNVTKNYLVVMLLTGALAGLAGGLVVMAGPHRFIKDLGANYAWDGVMIAMVANSNIALTLVFGVFFGILQTGAVGMELITAVPKELIMVLQAVIVLIVVAGRGYFDELFDKLEARRHVKERAV